MLGILGVQLQRGQAEMRRVQGQSYESHLQIPDGKVLSLWQDGPHCIRLPKLSLRPPKRRGRRGPTVKRYQGPSTTHVDWLLREPESRFKHRSSLATHPKN